MKRFLLILIVISTCISQIVSQTVVFTSTNNNEVVSLKIHEYTMLSSNKMPAFKPLLFKDVLQKPKVKPPVVMVKHFRLYHNQQINPPMPVSNYRVKKVLVTNEAQWKPLLKEIRFFSNIAYPKKKMNDVKSKSNIQRKKVRVKEIPQVFNKIDEQYFKANVA